MSVVCVTDDKAHYYPGADMFITKLIADKATHKLLGIQVLGAGAVDKMVDIAVNGIAMGATLENFDTLDYAYAPPFSTPIHPLCRPATFWKNKLTGIFETFTPAEYAAGAADDYQVIDVLPQASIPGAKWGQSLHRHRPHRRTGQGRQAAAGPVPGASGATSCRTASRAFGYTNTRVLEGGHDLNQVEGEVQGHHPAGGDQADQGAWAACRTSAIPTGFNIRVITRNGKITAEEQRVIAEAAERYGSGEVTMTTRLTLEIQCVPYDKLDELRAFLADAGLQTGAPARWLRPIVSCKGTTCQYGLLDSFGLSEKLHERFYWATTTSRCPHKFKIAVGGCPNNCVKPDLNDLGIVGQRVPMIDPAKCRGCKVCQVEANCPIHVAKLENGMIHIDPAACNHCGRCKGKCPFGVTEEFTDGYKIYLGGRWGKRIAHGHPMDKIFTSEEEVLDIVERAILFFRDEGITGERFADTIDRLGFDYVQNKLLTAPVDKDAVLQKKVTGGATC